MGTSIAGCAQRGVSFVAVLLDFNDIDVRTAGPAAGWHRPPRTVTP
ncbi:MAG: hypothetical protein ABI912_01900 [Actinomycetota bacterium]